MRGRLDFICDQTQRVSHIQPETAQTYSLHTALKLAALSHSLDVFLPNARKQVDDKRSFGGAVYIDLFAGSGLTRIHETGDLLAGSPLVAAGNRWPFDQIVCIEREERSKVVLEERLAVFRNRHCTTLHGDCNDIAPTLQSHIGFGNPLAFVFVDPEGMEIRWSTLVALSRQFPYMDLLMNFTHGAQRVLGDLRGGRSVNEQVMEAFAGPGWPMLLLEEGGSVVEFVEQNIAGVLGRSIGDKVLIRDTSNRPQYFLLVRIRQTRGGSPFFRGYLDMLKRVDGLTANDVRGALNDRFGRSLEAFDSREGR